MRLIFFVLPLIIFTSCTTLQQWICENAHEADLSQTFLEETDTEAYISYDEIDTSYINSIIEAEFESIYQEPEDPYQPTATKIADLIHTQLNLSFDWEKQYCYGKAIITLKPHFYPIQELEIDAIGFDVKEVKLLGAETDNNLQYSYDEKRLRITLDRTYNREDTLNIYIDYVARPSELLGKGLIEEEDGRGLFFINPDGTEEDVPRQLWSHNETRGASCWFPTLDEPNQRMSQELFITVEKDLDVISNGDLIYTTHNEDGTRTYCWKQDASFPPYLTAIAIGKYAKVSDTWRDVDVDYYVDPEYAAYAKDIFGKTPQMLSFFSDKFAFEYPWKKFAQVVVHDFVSGAMENSSCVFFGDFVQGNSRELIDYSTESIVAHELSHHWFGDIITCESWANIALNESFATYCEFLWEEHAYDRDKALTGLENDLNNYRFESYFKNVDVIRYHYNSANNDLFDCHSYSKGGLILHMLRCEVGDDAFFETLKLYLRKYQYKSVEIHDFRIVVEEVTGRDLNWFFNQWFLDKGNPVISYYWEYNDDKKVIELNIQQDQVQRGMSVFKVPLTLDVYVGEKRTEKEIIISSQVESLEIAFEEKPDLIFINNEKTILAECLPVNMDLDFRVLYNPERPYFYRKNAVCLVSECSLSDSLKELFFMKPLNDANENIRGYAVNYFSQKISDLTAGNKIILLNRMKELALNDPSAEVRSLALGFLGMTNDEGLITVFEQAVKDSSYSVSQRAISSLFYIFPETSGTFIESLEQSNDPHILSYLSLIYAYNGTPNNNNFYKEAINRTKGKNQFSIVDNYQVYLPESSDSIRINAFNFMKTYATESTDWKMRLRAFMILNSINNQHKDTADELTAQINYLTSKSESTDSLSEADKLMIDQLKTKQQALNFDIDYFNAFFDDAIEKEKDFRVLKDFQ